MDNFSWQGFHQRSINYKEFLMKPHVQQTLLLKMDGKVITINKTFPITGCDNVKMLYHHVGNPVLSVKKQYSIQLYKHSQASDYNRF